MSMALDFPDTLRPMAGNRLAADRRPETRSAGDYRRPARLGYCVIALTFGGLGGWAALAPLASATVASGQVAIESDRKPIQHLEGGILREILVHEAEHVAAGQVLFRLEPVQAAANHASLRKQLDADQVQEARLLAERDDRPTITLPPEIGARASDPGVAAILADETRQFAEHRRTADNDVKLLQARIEQADRDASGKRTQQALLKQQLDSYETELKGLADLVRKGFYPRNKMNVMDRERLRIAGELKGIDNDIDHDQGTDEEARLQIQQIRQRNVEAASSQLAEVRSKMADLAEKLTIAKDVLARQDVRAPKAGIIQAIKVHAVGAVLRGGEDIADLVTAADGLVVTARVSPADIQNAVAGQRTEIRFPSMAHSQMQPAFGRLESISADLVTDEKTLQTYYAARVVMDPATLEPGVSERLVPGMPADLLIINGEKTMLAYLMDPVLNRMTKTMRDR